MSIFCIGKPKIPATQRVELKTKPKEWTNQFVYAINEMVMSARCAHDINSHKNLHNLKKFQFDIVVVGPLPVGCVADCFFFYFAAPNIRAIELNL